MTDPIADMLTRIRNAYQARKQLVVLPFSKMKLAVLEILVKEGYIASVEKKVEGNMTNLEIVLKYNGSMPALRSVKRESKPGHRLYYKSEDLPKILGGFGIAVVSTSKGIMTAVEAKKQKIGGELLCSVY